MPRIDELDGVFVLDLGDGDNRFDAASVAEIAACLEVVAKSETPTALVTVASGKIWSNGLDLDYMGTLGDDWVDFVDAVQKLFATLLRLNVPTIAALQGHAFAAGAMFALAHDVRVMRSDRGYFCLPEVDLGLSFSQGFAALIAAKVSQPGLHRLAVLGERMNASDAVSLGVVDIEAPLDEVRDSALERARMLVSKSSPALGALRSDFYSDAIAALDPTSAGTR